MFKSGKKKLKRTSRKKKSKIKSRRIVKSKKKSRRIIKDNGIKRGREESKEESKKEPVIKKRRDDYVEDYDTFPTNNLIPKEPKTSLFTGIMNIFKQNQHYEKGVENKF